MILGDLEKGNGWLYRNKTPKANPLDATNFFPAQRIPPESALQGKTSSYPNSFAWKVNTNARIQQGTYLGTTAIVDTISRCGSRNLESSCKGLLY
jgi:hypothetical protein